MGLFLNCFYLIFLFFASPWIAWRLGWKGRSLTHFIARLTGNLKPNCNPSDQKIVWFHGVSVGEIHLLRQLVGAIQVAKPHWLCVVSSSTDNGLSEANKCFKGLLVFPFPLDFTWAINNAINRIKPNLIVLAESELWPNFLSCCKQRNIPVSVINGRISPKSQARYLRFPWLGSYFFSQIHSFGVQDEETERFLHLAGVAKEKTLITGSIKFDGVCFSKTDPAVDTFRSLFSIKPTEIIWVAGSTQNPEEEYILNAFKVLKAEFPNLRLVLVPRQPDLFPEVRKLLERMSLTYCNRSELGTNLAPEDSIILVDSLGELRSVWGLADLAFVGGSMDGKRGGQNMIEPAAYGCAVFFGDKVWNFKQVASQLIQTGGAISINSTTLLENTARNLIANASDRILMGQNAKNFVLSQQGATAKTITMLETSLTDRISAIAA